MKIEIKHKVSGEVLYSHECEGNTLKITLEKAVKEGINLSYSDISDSNLSGSDLRGIDLRGSNLRDSNLTIIRDDIWAILSSAPSEVQGLISALKNGRVDGSTYKGDCACLVGTLANVRKCDYQKIESLRPDSSRPAERFFLAIKEGDTPETSQFSSRAVEWCEEWLNRMQAAFKVVV